MFRHVGIQIAKSWPQASHTARHIRHHPFRDLLNSSKSLWLGCVQVEVVVVVVVVVVAPGQIFYTKNIKQHGI